MANREAINKSQKDVAILDSGASGIYLTPEAPKKQVNWSTPNIQVGTASVQPQTSSASYKLDLLGLPKDLPTSGHVIPGFRYNLIGIGKFCDADYKALFKKQALPYLTRRGSQ